MKRVVIALALGLLALIIAANVPVSRLSHTCVICRLYRLDISCVGVTIPRYSETDCSRWYSAHVERAHHHVWERGTCCYMSNLLGRPMGVGCRPGHYPIRLLDPTTQMQVYQHFKNPLDAKTLFLSMTDAKSYDDRLDEEDEDKGHLMVSAIQEWAVADFPGTWDDWWKRFYAAHVQERAEWMEWMKADSGLNFWDWQKQRKQKR